MYLDRYTRGIAGKILIQGEYCPTTTQGDRAYQKIYRISRYSTGTAGIVDRCGFFIVVALQWYIWKGTKQFPQP